MKNPGRFDVWDQYSAANLDLDNSVKHFRAALPSCLSETIQLGDLLVLCTQILAPTE